MENKTKTLNANFYPFVVSEKDSNGCIQLSQYQLKVHGFGILTDGKITSKLFKHENEGGVKQGTKVYEIRVKNSVGEWQDWQSIVGEIQIIPFCNFQLDRNIKKIFKAFRRDFQDNFEIRFSGLLWRSHFGEVTILDEESHLIKRINPFTLKVEYNVDLDNPCYPLEEQLEDQRNFKEKYYRYDEEGNRL